ncbi:LacI family transcription regulator [Sphingopyxis sp. LC81]|uniref:LacI family DNA-binding transcriptional regulator n=1 Tax=Sphingopyxis sp. LC81 TaxID=1502850 RepID=UPI00050EB34E|nr:LacI family DNA-binding transcriptional regulator [Sphingopyxis sp. LC81]KGB56286.1 LacI family transcription regulator [Sphingopyxis sp. LC81]
MAKRSKPVGTVTLKHVAEAAGVHASTVSRALNPATRHMVVPEVAERVAKLAGSLGYRPNLMAAGLRTGRSQLIGALVPDIANTVFSPILSGASASLAAQGYSILVADVGTNPARHLELANQLVARRIDGFILATVSRDDPIVDFCLEQNLPAVLVNRAEERRRLSAVVSDDTLGMQLAVDHLVALGHKRIGHLAGPETISTGHLRRKGFYDAIALHGLAAGNCPSEATEAYSREEGLRAGERLLASAPDITAIVAANDLLALGAYDAAARGGRSVPDDLSIVGHNDMPLVDMVAPPLTTVRISHQEIGRVAADLLLQQLTGKEYSTRNIVLAPTLIVRGSTATARGRDSG